MVTARTGSMLVCVWSCVGWNESWRVFVTSWTRMARMLTFVFHLPLDRTQLNVKVTNAAARLRSEEDE